MRNIRAASSNWSDFSRIPNHKLNQLVTESIPSLAYTALTASYQLDEISNTKSLLLTLSIFISCYSSIGFCLVIFPVPLIMIVFVANQIETLAEYDYCAVSRWKLIIDAVSLHLNLELCETISRIYRNHFFSFFDRRGWLELECWKFVLESKFAVPQTAKVSKL